MNMFLGAKILCVFFVGSAQNWTSLGAISMHIFVFDDLL